MKISQSLTVSCNPDKAWAFFQDIPNVASCFPGALLTEDRGNGEYVGNVLIKLGPFNATFNGEAKHFPNNETMSGQVDGKGIDKKGGSRSRLSLKYKLSEKDGLTLVDFEADIQLSGPIAQFGRVGVIEEVTQLLIEEFVKNVEAKIASTNNNTDSLVSLNNDFINLTQNKKIEKPRELSASRLFWSLIKRYLSKLFSRK